MMKVSKLSKFVDTILFGGIFFLVNHNSIEILKINVVEKIRLKIYFPRGNPRVQVVIVFVPNKKNFRLTIIILHSFVRRLQVDKIKRKSIAQLIYLSVNKFKSLHKNKK